MNVLLINSGQTINEKYISPNIVKEQIKHYFYDFFQQIKHLTCLVAPRMLLHSFLGDKLTQESRFPIGLGYLSAMLKQDGHSVYLVDRFADADDWVDNIHLFDFVGVYTSTPLYEDALRILNRLEAEQYKGRIAFGGPHTAVFPNTIPPRVDYVVQGEGEYIINDLVAGSYPSGNILRTQRIKEIDALPRVDYDLFMEKKRSYTTTMSFTDKQPIFNMNTSRSCPMECSFCSVREIWGRLWTSQSPERILDDILWLKKQYKVAGVYFREDFFPASKSRVFKLCELLIRNNVNIVWKCEIRADTASDEELVKIMARSGCKGFYVGAESGSQRMLNYYNKKITVEQIMKACDLAKKYGIGIFMALIVAHPMETWQDRLDTYNLVRRTKPEITGVNAYRDEFTRHGHVSFPTYLSRDIINVTFDNGTWKGQEQRKS